MDDMPITKSAELVQSAGTLRRPRWALIIASVVIGGLTLVGLIVYVMFFSHGYLGQLGPIELVVLVISLGLSASMDLATHWPSRPASFWVNALIVIIFLLPIIYLSPSPFHLYDIFDLNNVSPWAASSPVFGLFMIFDMIIRLVIGAGLIIIIKKVFRTKLVLPAIAIIFTLLFSGLVYRGFWIEYQNNQFEKGVTKTTLPSSVNQSVSFFFGIEKKTLYRIHHNNTLFFL